MAQDIPRDHVEDPMGRLPAPRTILLWVVMTAAVVLVVALGLASHRPGVPTVTPGQKSLSATQTALNAIGDRLQSLPIAHRKAATRQADANG